jgi:hypothetical protein
MVTSDETDNEDDDEDEDDDSADDDSDIDSDIYILVLDFLYMILYRMPFINENFLNAPNLGGKNLGGGISGISPKQTILNYKGGDQVLARRVVVKSWNTAYATGTVNGKTRVITPFRAVNNSGDFLGRVQYNCGGVNPTNADRPGWKSRIRNMFSNCDGSGIPPSTTNVKFVADSSDYAKYKKNRAINQLYNDNTFGGDQNHASYVPRMAVHRY